jgi:uncharacterized protein
MDSPVSSLIPRDIAEFRRITRRQQRELQAQMAHLSETAWIVARRAAEMLRQLLHATKVVVFGSLAHEECFSRWSDLIIVAWGIAPDDIFSAYCAALDIGSDFDITSPALHCWRLSSGRA